MLCLSSSKVIKLLDVLLLPGGCSGCSCVLHATIVNLLHSLSLISAHLSPDSLLVYRVACVFVSTLLDAHHGCHASPTLVRGVGLIIQFIIICFRPLGAILGLERIAHRFVFNRLKPLSRRSTIVVLWFIVLSHLNRGSHHRHSILAIFLMFEILATHWHKFSSLLWLSHRLRFPVVPYNLLFFFIL